MTHRLLRAITGLPIKTEAEIIASVRPSPAKLRVIAGVAGASVDWSRPTFDQVVDRKMAETRFVEVRTEDCSDA